jgi:hypothetical protein
MLALGTPVVALGVKLLSPETFSPGTVPVACSVTTPESDEAQLVTKALTAESKTMQIVKR